MARLRIAAAALLLAACGDREEAITGKLTLRYHPPTGAVYRYDVEQRHTMSMDSPVATAFGGGSELTTRLYFTHSVMGPTPAGIEVRLTVDSAQSDASGMLAATMAQALARLRGLASTVLFDERGHVLHTGFDSLPGVAPEVAAHMAAGVQAMAFGFPEEPVGPGDSWTVESQLPLGELLKAVSGAGGARTTLSVKGINVAGADTTLRLTVAMTFPRAPIQIRLFAQPAVLRLSGGYSGDQVFSLTRGVMVRGTMKGNMRVRVTGGPLGNQGMTLSTATEINARLAGAR